MTREKDTARNEGNQFQPYVAFSWLGGVMMAIALIAFLVEIIGTLGFADVLRLFADEARGRTGRSIGELAAVPRVRRH